MPSLRDGVTRIGVVLCISAHSIGTKAYSIHLSLVASRWGHPTGRVWFSSHSIEMKSSLDCWSGFLQDGVTLFGSDSNDLISSEGITAVGLLGAFSGPSSGVSFCHPLVGRSALKSGRVPHSVVFASGEDSVCIPIANEGVGLGHSSSSGPVASRQRRSGSWPFFFFWPCCLSPSPSGSVCFGGLAVIIFTWAFHALVFHACWLASCTSGSRTSR